MKQKNTVQARAVKRMMSLEADAQYFAEEALMWEGVDDDLKSTNSRVSYICKMELLNIYEIITGEYVDVKDYDEVIEAYHKWAVYHTLQTC